MICGACARSTSRASGGALAELDAGAFVVAFGRPNAGVSRVPFAWVGPMLAAGGGLLVLRGMIGAFLIFRPLKSVFREGAGGRFPRQALPVFGNRPRAVVSLHQRTKEEDRAQRNFKMFAMRGNTVGLAVRVIIV